MTPWCLGRPTIDGNTARGASSPANPALHIPDPLSTTNAETSLSHIFWSVLEFSLEWKNDLQYNEENLNFIPKNARWLGQYKKRRVNLARAPYPCFPFSLRHASLAIIFFYLKKVNKSNKDLNNPKRFLANKILKKINFPKKWKLSFNKFSWTHTQL